MVHPGKVVWYVEATSPKGGRVEGSAVAIRLQRMTPDDNGTMRGDPSTARTYLLTCAHVLRERSSDGVDGFGKLIPDKLIRAWMPETGRTDDQAKHVRLAKDIRPVDPREIPVSNRSNPLEDWIVLELLDDQSAQAAEGLLLSDFADAPSADGTFRVVGYPGGAASQQRGIVVPTSTGPFGYRDAHLGLLRLIGEQTAPGMSGGGVFEESVEQNSTKTQFLFSGLHRARQYDVLQLHSVSGPTILKYLKSDRLPIELCQEKPASKEPAEIWPDLPPAPTPPSPPAPSPPGQIIHGLWLAQLPGVTSEFTGRAVEFQRMVDHLRGGDAPAARPGLWEWLRSLLRPSGGGLVVIKGMGGVGKTTLAVKVAHAVKDRWFPDGQMMINLRGTSGNPLTAAEAMESVITAFSPDERFPDQESYRLARYVSALAGKKVLILLDDVRNRQQVADLIKVPPPVGFILTSRNNLGATGLTVELDVLPADEALGLVRRVVGPKGTDNELRDVADLCGLLPLALRVAADFLKSHDNWSVGEYIDRLRREAERLPRLVGDTPEEDVPAVLTHSVRELAKEDLGLVMKWQQLALLAGEFGRLRFDETFAATALNMNSEDALDTLTQLIDRGLLQYVKNPGEYVIHDLLWLIARNLEKYVGDIEVAPQLSELNKVMVEMDKERIISHWLTELEDANVIRIDPTTNRHVMDINGQTVDAIEVFRMLGRDG